MLQEGRDPPVLLTVLFFVSSNVTFKNSWWFNNTSLTNKWGFPGGASGKEPTWQCRRHKRHRFDPWIGKIPWRRAWQPTPVFLPGESQGQEPGGLQSIESQRVGHNWCDLACTSKYINEWKDLASIFLLACYHNSDIIKRLILGWHRGPA